MIVFPDILGGSIKYNGDGTAELRIKTSGYDKNGEKYDMEVCFPSLAPEEILLRSGEVSEVEPSVDTNKIIAGAGTPLADQLSRAWDGKAHTLIAKMITEKHKL